MSWVRCSVVILGMAGIAIRWHRRIVPGDVATRARYRRVEASQREGGLTVIEHGSGPRSRRVAGGAGGRKSRGNVVWIGRIVVVLGMARVAVRRGPHEDIIDMAAGAGHRGVESGQREGRVVVIEHGACPRSLRMAGRAGCREASSYMAWIRGVVVIRLVATIAILRNRRVVAVDVALNAGERRVETNQREYRRVIENRGIPGRRRVAGRASRREAAGHVARVRRVFEVLRMTGVTIRRSADKDVVDMATGAGHRDMEAGKREGCLVVIKHGSGPRSRRMAGSASRRETR